MQKSTFVAEVSIITPCYNASKYLSETVSSVLDQTFTDWEWIISDDNSADNSVEIIEGFKDPRIVLIKNKTNQGAGHARNEALRLASGRYITFLDADDYWEVNFLEEMIQFMKTNMAELAYSNYSRCNENLEPQINDFEADTVVTFQNLLKTCRLSLLSSMYDSKRVGKEYFPVGSKREDHVMWLNLLKKIPQGKPLRKTMAKYRMHESSVSRDKKKIFKDQYLVYKEHLQFSTAKSLYYTMHWALNGFLKYSKWFN